MFCLFVSVSNKWNNKWNYKWTEVKSGVISEVKGEKNHFTYCFTSPKSSHITSLIIYQNKHIKKWNLFCLFVLERNEWSYKWSYNWSEVKSGVISEVKLYFNCILFCKIVL